MLQQEGILGVLKILFVGNIIENLNTMGRGKWGNAGQGVMPDNSVLANRGTLVIFDYPVAIAT